MTHLGLTVVTCLKIRWPRASGIADRLPIVSQPRAGRSATECEHGRGLSVLAGTPDSALMDPDRAGYRHGSEAGSVTLGGRRVAVTRPRVRAADGSGELRLPSYDLFSSTEILGQMALQKMLAGLSSLSAQLAGISVAGTRFMGTPATRTGSQQRVAFGSGPPVRRNDP